MGDWRLINPLHRNVTLVLPPNGTRVKFDEDGTSDVISEETARECATIPGFNIFDSPQTVPGETDTDGNVPGEAHAAPTETTIFPDLTAPSPKPAKVKDAKPAKVKDVPVAEPTTAEATNTLEQGVPSTPAAAEVPESVHPTNVAEPEPPQTDAGTASVTADAKDQMIEEEDATDTDPALRGERG